MELEYALQPYNSQPNSVQALEIFMVKMKEPLVEQSC